jgi:hypothetical protein
MPAIAGTAVGASPLPEVSMEDVKRRWETPELRKFGTFEAATQRCIKALGSSDGFTFQGVAVPIHWCGS